MKAALRALLALAMLVPAAANAETKEEWIALGARIHGAFGPFIPVGIRIGLDAVERLIRSGALLQAVESVCGPLR